MVLCPTLNSQSQWTNTIFQQKDTSHLRIDEFSQNKLLVFDHMQTDLKKNQLITEMFMKGRHHGIGKIQCEQFIQDRAHIEKANTDFIVLIPPFSISTA